MSLLFKKSLVEIPRTYDGLPSVTSVLSVMEDPNYIRKWKAQAEDESVVNDVIDKARKRGRYVHLVAANYYKTGRMSVSEEELMKFKRENDLPEIDSKVFKILNGFSKFISQEELIPVQVEEPLLCKELGVAGTPDIIGGFRGKMSVLDWKTSSSSRLPEDSLNKYFIQAAAYAGMWNLLRSNNKIEQLVIVPLTHSRANGLGEIEIINDKTLIQNYFLQFLECREQFLKLWKSHPSYPQGKEILNSQPSQVME